MERNKTIECAKGTWIDPEEVCTDIGQFRRRAVAIHEKTQLPVRCQAAIPDTYFSVPATTKIEHGFITGRENGALYFVPHIKQDMTPAEYRKAYRRRCK